MVAAAYYAAKWHEHEGKRQLLLGAFFLAAAVLTRYDYLIIVFPLLFIFPWKRAAKLIFHPDTRRWWAIGALILCIIPLWLWYSNLYLPTVLPQEKGAIYGDIIDLSKAFTAELWEMLKLYFADNFTFTGLGFAIFGLAAFLALYKKSHVGHQFFLGYIVGVIPWFLVMSDKLNGHSYHQYPLVPLFAFLVAYGFTVIGSTLQKFLKFRFVHTLVVILLLVWLWAPSTTAMNRQFDTQFFGLDIAGEYIRGHSEPNERVFHSSGQDYGVLWHANRMGFKNPGNTDELELGEQYNVTWIFLYQWGFSMMQNKPVWDEIKSKYHATQFAFVQNGQQLQPVYLLLQKGGTFDEQQLGPMVQNAKVQQKSYDLTGGNHFTLSYVDLG